MPALHPIGVQPVAISEEDGALVAVSTLRVLATSAGITGFPVLICASTTSIVATSAALTTGQMFWNIDPGTRGGGGAKFLFATTVSLSAATLLSASSVMSLTTFASLPQSGLTATNNFLALNIPRGVWLSTSPDLRCSTTAPIFTSTVTLSATIPLSGSAAFAFRNTPSYPPALSTSILLYTPQTSFYNAILPPDVRFYSGSFDKTQDPDGTQAPNTLPELTCQSFLFSSVNLLNLSALEEGHRTESKPSLGNEVFLTSTNSMVVAVSNNAILSTGIPLSNSLSDNIIRLTRTLANLGTGAALVANTSILRATTSAYLQTVVPGTLPPDRSQRIRSTNYKRLKVAAVGAGLNTDYTDINMTATG